MANAIAPESPNVVTGIMPRLVAMTFAPPPPLPTDPQADTSKLSDQLLDGLKLEVLKGAWVILMPVSDGTRSLNPDVASAILARTRDDGQLVGIEEAELSASVPGDPARPPVFLEAGWEYACFWTPRGALCEAVWRELKGGASAGIVRNPFFRFRAARHRPSGVVSSLPLKPENEAKLRLLVHGRDGAYGGETVHGYLLGSQLRDAKPAGAIDAQATYVVARSDAVGALYLAEVANRAAVAKRAATAEDLAVLDGLRGMAESASDGARVQHLDGELRTFIWRGERMRRDPAQDALNDRFVEYAHDCARARVPRSLFWKAANVLITQTDWKSAARKILEQHHVVHPNYDEDGRLQPYKPNAEGVLAYFDYFEFGVRAPGDPWWEASLAAKQDLDRQLQDLSKRLRGFCEKRMPYQAFLAEIDAHLPEGAPPRKALHDAYLSAAATFEFRWWESFAPESDQEWAAFEKYVGWIASLSDKLGDLFSEFYGGADEIFAQLAFNRALAESVDALERFFSKMKCYDGRFPGGRKPVTRHFGNGMKLTADFAGKRYVVSVPGKEPFTIGPVEFLWVEGTVKETNTVQLKRRKSKPRNKRFKQVTRDVPAFSAVVTDAPFRSIKTWPAWLGAFGDVVSLGLTIKNFNDDLKSQNAVDVYFKAAQNVFQGIGSLADAVAVTLKSARAGGAVGKVAGVMLKVGKIANVGAAIEAVYNVKEGSVLLFDSEDSAVVEALDRGEEWEAGVLMTKGWILVSSVVPGTVAFGSAVGGALFGGGAAAAGGGALAAGVGAAASPLAIGLAIGAIVVVLIDVHLSMHHGPDGAFAPILKRLQEVVRAEFGDDKHPGPSRTVKDITKYCTGVDPILARLGQ